VIRKIENLPFLKYKTNSREEMYSKRPHSHEEVSIGYIETGRTTITVQNRHYLLSPGDVVLIPSRTVHICVPENVPDFKFIMFYIDEAWWKDHFSVAPDTFQSLAFPAGSSFREFITIAGGRVSPGTEEILTGALKDVLDKYEPGDIRTDPGEEEIEKIHNLIRDMPEASLSLEGLASRAGFNKYSFIRRYSGRYGLTPHADIVNMRIQRAVLLLETDMDLADVALNCGFSDQSHFNHQFKLYCGLRPLEYRKGIRKI